METNKKPVGNPMIVLREEFDDWAILFDPDTAKGFGLSPVSAMIWKMLDGKHSISDIAEKIKSKCNNVPDDVELHVSEFVDQLLTEGLAGNKSEG